MGRIFAFLFIVSLIGLIVSQVAWRRTRKKIVVFSRARDLDFVCAPHSTVVNNISEVDEATELHIICCVYCLFELANNPARLDVMKMSQGMKEFLKSAIAPLQPDPEEEPDEPAHQ